jgi:hypothetical protein
MENGLKKFLEQNLRFVGQTIRVQILMVPCRNNRIGEALWLCCCYDRQYQLNCRHLMGCDFPQEKADEIIQQSLTIINPQ